MSNIYKLLLVLLIIPMVTIAGTYGSRGLVHVQSASTLDPGTLELRSNLRFFTKVGEFLGENKPANFSAVNYWLVQSNVLLTYGVMEHFDLTVMNRVYQDNHKPSEYNSPEDIFIDAKIGSFGLSNNKFNYGFLIPLRIPVGKDYNYPFEEYTAGGFEFGITGLFSYFNDPYLHDRSFSLHANLGWYNYNDAGKELYTDNLGQVYKADGNASSLKYGLGFKYPTELFDLNLELWGNAFTSEPDTMAYSRESFMYFTPAIRFKPRPWFSFDLGIDIRLSSDKNTSKVPESDFAKTLDLPNYPAWLVHMGANFRLMPVSSAKRPGEKADVRSKVDFFENLLRERERTRSIEDELRRLKKEREQAERELEELRQMLEEQGK
ncbi:MAG: hypothetical protein Kow0037_19060 [Calditrichia bacterium]